MEFFRTVMTANFPETVSLIIPAYNEELAVRSVVDDLAARYPEFQLIVVNDGSTDRTASVLEGARCSVISHKTNRGYGASWKTGVSAASGSIVVFYDGDGQFDPRDVGRIVEEFVTSNADMIVGARTDGSHVDLSRRPGKSILKALASFLARTRIPDPNCGLRAVRRDLLQQYLYLLPDGFSASLTSLLLFYKRRYQVGFVPIVVKKRLGKSSVRQIRDGFGTIMLMTRLIALFDPLRIFLPVSGVLVGLGIVYSILEALIHGLGVPVLGGIMIIGGLLCFFLGIVCDQISALRLERFSTPGTAASTPNLQLVGKEKDSRRSVVS